jgi:hypothetical protein
MDTNAVFNLVTTLSTIIMLLAIGLGFLYVLLMPEEKK